MKRIQARAKHLAFAAVACTLLGFASTASAELKVCNGHPTQTILYTHIISDFTCVGAKRQEGWAFI